MAKGVLYNRNQQYADHLLSYSSGLWGSELINILFFQWTAPLPGPFFNFSIAFSLSRTSLLSAACWAVH